MNKVLHYVSLMNRAGQETFIMNMYRNMNRKQIQFGFLCSKSGEGDYDKEIKDMGGKIYHVELENSSSKLRHIRNYKRLRKAFKKLQHEYQVVHIHNYHAFDMMLEAMAALRAGFRKVIVHSHNSSADGHLTLHKISRPILSLLPVIKLACSDSARDWMFIKHTKVTIIDNGIITERFIYDSNVREKYRKNLCVDNYFVIGNVARFFPQKNHEFIIKLFYEYSKVNPLSKLLLIGTGDLEQDYKDMVKEYGIDDLVIFMGVREDVEQLYQAMDMFLFPSFFEGLGIVAIEAQAADLPVLISDGVPNCVCISEKCFQCNLNDDIDKWMALMEKCRQLSLNSKRKNNSILIDNAGFSAKSNAKKMLHIYLR